ncbi:MAG TPA: helix-turn-helix domain-containing protein [Trebonia sp.]
MPARYPAGRAPARAGRVCPAGPGNARAPLDSEDSVPPHPGTGPREIRKIDDARTFRALTHPVRIALLEALLLGGAQTATEAGEQIGETPTTCSFHLRQLAKYGFVEEAGGGQGRSRPWRLTSVGLSLAPASGDREAEAASEGALRLLRGRQLARYETWRATRSSYPEEWRDAATDSEYLFYLTPGELHQMNTEIHQVMERWFGLEGRVGNPARRPAGSAPVEALLFNFPIGPPQTAAGTAREEDG